MRTHAWMPTSPCDTGCLDTTSPRVGVLRTAFRAVRLLIALVVTALDVLLRFGSDRRHAVRAGCSRLLRACGARLVVHGGEDLVDEAHAGGRGVLVVSNHISWLDIPAVNALTPMRSLAKADIQEWPVLGGLIARAGTIFVDRERLSTLPGTVAELTDALRGGALVNVCAEGTTWCGAASGPFVPAPFQAAIDGGVPVRPIALRYRLASGTETTRPSFLGEESLFTSVLRVLRLRALVVEVVVCDEIAPGRAGDRGELARLAEASVRSALGHDTVASARRVLPLRVRTRVR
ncbi:MAG: 1-acyl-sn-glycerol-3-phosphate acyltransferase [Actinophytocola sp.]|nr:1-acyl-sn-glycerol-3-phosphate acyltransferase [Actinophytocola sp.]